MRLEIPKDHSFTQNQLDKLAPYLGKEISFEDFVKLPSKIGVAMAINSTDSNDRIVSIDHPIAW